MSFDTDMQAMLQEDATRLSSGERAVMLTQALRELSSDVPREITRDFTGTGAASYALVSSSTADPAVAGILSDWARGVSRVRAVRVLVVDRWEPLDLEHWRVGEDKFGVATVEWLPALILSEGIDSSTVLRVDFTKAWAESDPELAAGRLYTAALELACAYAHAAIASEYSAMTDAVLEADSVDQGSLASRHMDLHDLHRKNYRKLVGLAQDDGKGSAPGTSAASAQKDLVDWRPSYGGVSLRRGYGR